VRSLIHTSVAPIHKGSQVGTTIQISLSITSADLPGTIFRNDAKLLYNELRTHLPNGTYEELRRLFAGD